MTLYVIFRALFRIYFKLFFKWQVIGTEHIPRSKPIILTANHISLYDPPVIGSAVDRQVHFMAKEELFRLPLLGRLIKSFGTFPVKRGGSDRKSIKTGLELLQAQKVLGIFPEGTRSKDGKLGKGLPGAALFALKSDAVVIPVGIVSNYKWFQPIKVKFGPPISLEAFKKEKVSSKEVIHHMMKQIQIQIDDLKK